LNSNVFSAMTPYLVDAPPSLNAEWLRNPNPDVYTSWEEFAKRLWWDYQMGEAFVLATARYATGWPSRFHVLPAWSVNVELRDGIRVYSIGAVPLPTADVLHIRYTSTVDDAHGHGPLEIAARRVAASAALDLYAANLAAGGGIPTSVLEHPEELTQEQSALLKAQWVQSRLSSIGEPAVLSGGVTWKPTQINPRDMALLELSQYNEARIAVMLGVPPWIVALPSGGDPMTYANANGYLDFHWRAHLRPRAKRVMSDLAGWALPRGVGVEVNADEYVQPGPKERAETYQILAGIQDTPGANQAMTVDEIRQAERLDNASPELTSGVLR
jgi:HK97 family phage portal protein